MKISNVWVGNVRPSIKLTRLLKQITDHTAEETCSFLAPFSNAERTTEVGLTCRKAWYEKCSDTGMLNHPAPQKKLVIIIREQAELRWFAEAPTEPLPRFGQVRPTCKSTADTLCSCVRVKDCCACVHMRAPKVSQVKLCGF